jgi:hypothetical protein
MKLQPHWRTTILILCWVTILLPGQQIRAANPDTPTGPEPAGDASDAAVSVRDVKLQDGGVLEGQVVGAHLEPCRSTVVRLSKMGGAVGQTMTVNTDAEGRFRVTGLGGGVYRVETVGGVSICRLWSPNAAPPSVSSALMVRSGTIWRGDCSWRHCCVFTNPLVIGLAGAAAIAIPLVVQNVGQELPPGSRHP